MRGMEGDNNTLQLHLGRVYFISVKYQEIGNIISRPGRSQELLYKQPRDWLIHSFNNSVGEPFPPTALRRRHAQTVRDSTSSYKIDYVIVIKNFLNLEGHHNPTSGSKVTDILLKGWILPIGGASAGEGLPCSLCSRLVCHIICRISSTGNRKANLQVYNYFSIGDFIS